MARKRLEYFACRDVEEAHGFVVACSDNVLLHRVQRNAVDVRLVTRESKFWMWTLFFNVIYLIDSKNN